MDFSRTGVLGFINNLSGIALIASFIAGAIGLIASPSRRFCGKILYYASVSMGLSVWLWCAQVVHALWGTVALVIGLMFFGVGVAPMALIATAVHGHPLGWITFGGIVLNLAAVFVARFVGIWMVDSYDKRSQLRESPAVGAEAEAL